MLFEYLYLVVFDDCIVIYVYVLECYVLEYVVIGGCLVGGNFVVVMVLCVCDEGLLLLVVFVLLLLEVDLIEFGDSFEINCLVDVVLLGLLMVNNLFYVNGVDFVYLYLLLLFGDFVVGFLLIFI